MASPGLTVVRNTGSLTTARVAVAVSGLISVAIIFDTYGQQDFGIWVLVTSFATVVALVDLGLASASVREVAFATQRDQHRTPQVMALALAWACLFVPLLAVLVVIFWPIISSPFGFGSESGMALGTLLWLLAALFVSFLEIPWRAVLEGHERYSVVSWVTACSAMATVMLTWVVATLGASIVALGIVAFGVAVGRLGAIAVSARSVNRGMRPSLRTINRTDLRVFGNYGIRVQVSGLSGAVNTEADRIILGITSGPAVAGGFDIGNRLLNVIRLPGTSALMAMFPAAVAGFTAHGSEWLNRFYLAAFRILAVMAATSTAILVVGADSFIELWLGESVEWAAASLAILAPAYALTMIAGPAVVTARAEGRPGQETRYSLLSVVLNVVLTVPFLYVLGPVGVPAATSLGVGLASIYFLFRFHKLSMRPSRPVLISLAKVLSGAAVAGSTAFLLTSGLPAGGRVAGGFQVLLTCAVVVGLMSAWLWIWRYFSSTEREILRSVMSSSTASRATSKVVV